LDANTFPRNVKKLSQQNVTPSTLEENAHNKNVVKFPMSQEELKVVNWWVNQHAQLEHLFLVNWNLTNGETAKENIAQPFCCPMDLWKSQKSNGMEKQFAPLTKLLNVASDKWTNSAPTSIVALQKELDRKLERRLVHGENSNNAQQLLKRDVKWLHWKTNVNVWNVACINLQSCIQIQNFWNVTSKVHKSAQNPSKLNVTEERQDLHVLNLFVVHISIITNTSSKRLVERKVRRNVNQLDSQNVQSKNWVQIAKQRNVASMKRMEMWSNK
jgi:hypothetical protein